MPLLFNNCTGEWVLTSKISYEKKLERNKLPLFTDDRTVYVEKKFIHVINLAILLDAILLEISITILFPHKINQQLEKNFQKR